MRARAGINPAGGHLPETEALLRAHLGRAIELAPLHADAYDLLAHVELGAGDLARAESLLRSAAELAPARAGRYALTLAQVHAQRGDRDAARRQLDAVAASSSSDAALRARALELLDAMRNQEESEDGRAGGEAFVPETPSASSVRRKAEGEEQARGDLVTVECAADEVFLHLLVGGRTLRFRAQNFERLPLVSYDPAMAYGRDRKLSCGARAAANHVLLTYRPAPDAARATSDGEVVAVDFVPREWK
jgi:tetratricopeptide (TPR) repeat protein